MLKKILIKRLRKFQNSIKKRQLYLNFYKRFIEIRSTVTDGGRFECKWENLYPCVHDATATTPFDTHYIHHTAWAARILAKERPAKHVDIGSWLPFVTEISAFIPMDFYDYRPPNIKLNQLTCRHGNILSLPFCDKSIISLSCMHVVEHIGLERYGDPFDPQGDIKAMLELQRVLAPQGSLLFVIPIGNKAVIEYNAHRIYTYNMIISYFNELKLQQFSFVTDSGKFIEHASPLSIRQDHCGCGCFHFRR